MFSLSAPDYWGLLKKQYDSAMNAILTPCHQGLIPQNCSSTLLCYLPLIIENILSIHRYLKKIILQIIRYSGIILILFFYTRSLLSEDWNFVCITHSNLQDPILLESASNKYLGNERMHKWINEWMMLYNNKKMWKNMVRVAVQIWGTCAWWWHRVELAPVADLC